MLLGADVASQLLLEKRTSRGNVAWKTELGWVLYGPQTKIQSQHDGNPVEAVVSYVSAYGSSLDEQVRTLFELESQTVTEGRAGPAFPLVASNGSYEIGLLWKGTARPESNESQAYASAKSQMAHLYQSIVRKTLRPRSEWFLIRRHQ